MKLKHYTLLAAFIIFCSCGTQNNNISKPSAGLSISPAATTLLDVIVGKFPGITVIGDNVANGNPKILIRGGSLSINNQAYAIFDIDGSIQTDFPSYIDPQQIKSISILKSLSNKKQQSLKKSKFSNFPIEKNDDIEKLSILLNGLQLVGDYLEKTILKPNNI